MDQSSKQERHLPLDFLRGLAAFGIAVYHYLAWTKVVTVESLGRFGVYTFFILSALTMSMVYSQTFSSGLTASNLRAFYRNRFARIVPLLLTVAVINLIQDQFQGPPGRVAGELIRALLTSTTLFALQLPGYLSNATGAWSLGIEMAFYGVFPIIIILAQSSKAKELVVSFLILLVGQQALLVLVSIDFPTDARSHWRYLAAPLTFAPFFAIGLLIYFHPPQKRLANFWLGSGLFVCAMASSLVIKADVLHSPLNFLALTVSCGVSVALLYQSEVPSLLGHLSEFIGNISYSLYLTHPFAFLVVSRLAKKFGIGSPLSFVLFVSIAAALAYLSFRYFEMPARNLLRVKREFNKDPSSVKCA